VSMYWPPAYNVWAAKEIKDVVSIPVIASGGINSPELAEKILEEGKSDFIALGRPLEADPYFPLKAKEGRPEDIRPCIRCGDCQDRGSHLSSVHCAVNAADLREEELKITPATKLKKVAVVGGGPAGMEAARIAALRGHQVTLFEKRKLGGMLIEASTPEFKADIRMLINYLSTQVKKTGVKVINSEATSKTIIDGKFDVAIVATGGIPRVPDILGLDKPCVVTALDVLGGAELGKNIIVVGGGQIGCDVALFLAEQGKRVTITTRGDNIGKTMGFITTLAFRERLSKQDFEIRTGVHLDEVTDSGIIVYDRFDVKSEIKGDNVILASGLMSNRKLFDELSQVPDLEVFAVGDCVEPRTIFDAIHEGYSTALLLI
jgi:pyruvate/2-oxoglutarate dehydrogenase complex dihydrolipoamide dehydrogenase (E3) component